MPIKNQPPTVQAGQRFHYLTVLAFSHQDKRWRRHYKVKCKCGKEKTVQGTLLTTGNTKSCGCWSKEAARLHALPHGEASLNLTMAGYRHKARKAGVVFSLTVPQFRQVALAPCFYCGASLTNLHKSAHGTGDFAYNGLDRIDSRKGYRVNNVVSCCKRCNFAKSNRSQGDFIRWIKTAYEYLAKTAMADQWGAQ